MNENKNKLGYHIKGQRYDARSAISANQVAGILSYQLHKPLSNAYNIRSFYVTKKIDNNSYYEYRYNNGLVFKIVNGVEHKLDGIDKIIALSYLFSDDGFIIDGYCKASKKRLLLNLENKYYTVSLCTRLGSLMNFKYADLGNPNSELFIRLDTSATNILTSNKFDFFYFVINVNRQHVYYIRDTRAIGECKKPTGPIRITGRIEPLIGSMTKHIEIVLNNSTSQ